jgi:hypothetical protein
MIPRARPLAAAGALLVALSARPADGAPPTTDAAWQMLYDGAIALLDRGEPAPACPMLEDAARFRAGAGVLLALGRCYAASGRPALALARYREALAAAPLAKQDRAGKERLAREGVAAMEPKVARVEVTLPSGASATLDGVPVASGAIVEVDPGAHEVEVNSPPAAPRRVRVDVAAGARVAPDLAIAAPVVAAARVEPAPPSPSEPAPAPARRSRLVPAVALGVSAVGVVTMVVGGGLALHDKGVIATECDAAKRCSADGLGAVDGARTHSALGTAGAVVGLAGLAGFVTWLVWPTPRATSVAPAVAPGFGGVSIARSF